MACPGDGLAAAWVPFTLKECLTMSHRKTVRYASGLLLAGGVAALALSSGCSAADALQGCDEFSGGSASVAALQIDGNSKAFVTAAADFVGAVSSMETAVYTACAKIDTDLHVTDTWSAKGSLDDQTNEACAQAANKINAILAEGVSVQAACYLSISGGHCEVDANVEATCEGQCTGAANCTPPDVMVACQPGDLSVQCSDQCQLNATCEGTVMAAATCQGSCSADCTGECDITASAPTVRCEGTCTGKCTGTCDGSTANGTTCAGTCSGTCDANCKFTGGVAAHCNGSCNGSCTGDCKLDANATVNCGANVRCKGGCNVTGTAPQCEGEVTPPMCNVDAHCQASCQGHAEATASCTPPAVAFECDATATPDMMSLVATLKTNLPVILQAVQTQGPLAVKAGGHVASTGADLLAAAGSIGGKAAACITTAVPASAKASVSVSVSVMASASVSGSCGGPKS
jgi:hypothetical protein